MDQSVADFYGIDLKKLIADAQASGFNPLTIIRNGGLAAYMIGVNTVADGSDFTGEYGGGELDFVGGGGGGGGGDFFSYAYYDDWGPKGDRKALQAQADAERKANSPMVYYEQAVETVRSAGGTPIAVPANNGGSGSGSPRVRTATTTKPEPKMKDGFQQSQIWDKDKQPNVIKDSTFHYLLPGVTWEEQGGTTRVEMFETGYGEDAPGTQLLGLPKFLNDLGWNYQRGMHAIGVPTLQELSGKNLMQHAYSAAKSLARLGERMQAGINAQPTFRDQYGRTTFQEPSDIGVGGSKSARPTPSYAAAKSASKSSSTVTSAAPSASSKDKVKEKSTTTSSTSGSSKTKSSSSGSKSDTKSSSGGKKKK